MLLGNVAWRSPCVLRFFKRQESLVVSPARFVSRHVVTPLAGVRPHHNNQTGLTTTVLPSCRTSGGSLWRKSMFLTIPACANSSSRGERRLHARSNACPPLAGGVLGSLTWSCSWGSWRPSRCSCWQPPAGSLGRQVQSGAEQRRRCPALAGARCLAALGAALALLGLVSALRLLVQVPLPTWGTLLLATLATWLRTLIALLIGVVWTVPAGVAIGLSPKWSRRLQPVVQVVASIPATALFPILLLALVGIPGGLQLSAVLLMLLGTQWYILFNVIAGAMAIPSDLREATTVYHASGWRKWRTLILPAIFPYLITGLLTASGGAWNASIVSEYVQFGNHTVHTLGLGDSIAEALAANN